MIRIIEEFKIRFQKALEYRNLKPIDIARRTGISEATISQYRSGYSKPKEERLTIIANALDVNPAWLMGLNAPMTVPVSSPPSPSPDLDPDDQELLSKYHMLSEEGKGMLQDRADELIALGKTVEEEAKKDARKLG